MTEAAVAFIGSIEVFNIGDDFELYKNRFEQLLSLNKIVKDGDKISFLISLGGADLYKTLISLLAPKTQKDHNYAYIVEKFTSHFKPKKNIIEECFKFFKREQLASEKIADYIVELKQMAQECDFGNFLDRALLIKFVCGLNNEHIQNRLLNESELATFEKACTIALSLDMTSNNMELMRNNSVHQLRSNARKTKAADNTSKQEDVQRRRSKSRKRREIKCFYCQKVGHMERNCWEKQNAQKSLDKNKSRGKYKSNSSVNNIDYTDNDFSFNYLNNIACNPSNSLKVNIKLAGTVFKMEVDTGACVSVCHIADYNKTFKHIKMNAMSKNLKFITGESVVVVGSILVDVEFMGNRFNLELVVLDSKAGFDPLLGRNWLDVIVPQWRGIFGNGEINQLSNNLKLNTFDFYKYNQLFSKDNNSTIKSYVAEIVLKDEHYPIFAKAYSVPFGLRKKVEDEIGRLCQQGVIVPVSRSRWASPIVIVNKGDGSIRLCVNCRRTVNRFIEMEYYVIP
ncbi:uncharacterized protein K02A2.6-like [Rhagoletis pomonella]|uniref:uncharacterized protein K02A2.6-like n=1 Tax=Rhagoletis pomonella TaxID=28610 RepID=UPI00177C11F0|nr:uncharacterized protein K02A2.6-like [Rhagoletis pomonella]